MRCSAGGWVENQETTSRPFSGAIMYMLWNTGFVSVGIRWFAISSRASAFASLFGSPHSSPP